MGAAQSTTSANRITELSDLDPGQDENQQFVEKDQCCWIPYNKVSHKSLTWESNFKSRLKALKKDKHNQFAVPWMEQLSVFMDKKRIKYSRIPFIKQVNEIKYAKTVKIVEQKDKQILLSACQVEKFKANLKKSVLVSAASIKQKNISPMAYSSFAMPKKLINAKQQQIEMINNDQKSVRPPQSEHQSIRSSDLRRSNQRKFHKDMYTSHFHRSVIKQRTGSQASSRGNLRGSIISFVDETISSLLKGNQLDQISKENALLLECFVKLTVIIEGHSKSQLCIINRIKDIFSSHVETCYSISDPTKPVQFQLLENLINSIILFIEILTQVIYQYYNLGSFQNPISVNQKETDGANQEKYVNPLIASQQNILAFVTALIFKEDRIYGTLFELVRRYNAQRQEKFLQVIKGLQNTGPQFFEVKPQYCLNSSTLRSFIKKENIADSKMQNLQISDLDSENDTNKNQIPYKDCVVALRQLQKTKTPISKLKAIMECAELIIGSIQKFYTRNSMDMGSQVLDADQILSIFCYLVVKAQVKDIHSHMFILEHFSTDHQLISVTGYYYSVLTCAIQQIQKDQQRSLHANVSDVVESSEDSQVMNVNQKFLNRVQNTQQKAQISRILQEQTN